MFLKMKLIMKRILGAYIAEIKTTYGPEDPVVHVEPMMIMIIL
jgi:hypothetical protein